MSDTPTIDLYTKPFHELPNEDAAKLLSQRYKEAVDAALPQHLIWDYAWLAYRGVHAQTSMATKSYRTKFGLYINVPRPYLYIESIRANIPMAEFPFYVVGYGGPADKRKAPMVQAVLRADYERSNTELQFDDNKFNMLLLGTGVLKNELRDEDEEYEYFQNYDEEGNPVYKKETRQRYYGMVSNDVDPYDFFPDPHGASINETNGNDAPCRYTFHRHIWHIADARKRLADFIDPAKIVPGGDLRNFKQARYVMDALFQSDPGLRYPGTIEDFTNKVVRTNTEMQPMYSPSEYVEVLIYDEKDAHCIWLPSMITEAETFGIISKGPNPLPHKKLPYTLSYNVKVPGLLWGIGEPEATRYQNIEENRVHNMVLEAIYTTIKPIWAVNEMYLQEPADLQLEAGKMVKMKMMQGIKPDDVMKQFSIQPSGSLSAAFQLLGAINSTSQSTTAVTDFVASASGALADSASEVKSLGAASQKRIGRKLDRFNRDTAAEVFRQWIACYPQFYTNEMTFRLGGRKENGQYEFIKLAPYYRHDPETKKEANILPIIEDALAGGYTGVLFLDDLEGGFDVAVKASSLSTADEVTKKMQYLKILQDINQSNVEVDPTTGQPKPKPIFNIGAYGKKILSLLEPLDDPEDFILAEQAPTDVAQPTSGENVVPQTQDAMMRSAAQPDNMGVNQLQGDNASAVAQ